MNPHHKLLGVFIACLALAGCASPRSDTRDLATETFMIPSRDAGIQLHVRNKRPADEDRFPPERILLLVHGATWPSETGFDIDLPGGSWMENIARRGFDVYFVDIRGYGRSTRPAAMEQPPTANPPFASTRDAINDIGAAVDFILERRGVARINLLGWSWGTTTMAGYAAENPAKVERLVLYAPVWYLPKPPPYVGAYRMADGAKLKSARGRGIPRDRLEETFPAAWYDQWWKANLNTDPGGAARNPPVVRAPNGVMKDLAEVWANGKSTYDPGAIKAPTLLVVGEWDGITPPAMAQALFKELTAAQYRRLVVLSGGSHSISLEKNRAHLMREVQHFLEEPGN